MKKRSHNLPYSSDAFKLIDHVISIEEIGICITDFYTNKILFVNSKMTFYTGESDLANLMGKSCREDQEVDRKAPCPFCSHMNLLDREGNPLSPYIREQYVEDLNIWLKIITQAFKWAGGSLIRIVTLYDITEAQRMREQFSDFMLRDRLLGLKNGAGLKQDLQQAPVKPSLLLFEVLSMRKINEYYGWEIGDYLLCMMRDTILSKNVPGSELYRIGGDKFCLTVDHLSQPEIKKLAHDMSLLFTGTWKFDYKGTAMQAFNNVSIAAIYSSYIQDDESLLSMIERMLARAKERKKVAIYNKKIDKAYKDRLRLEWDLKRCVHENMCGFDIYYQPIVDCGSEMWCGLEALCRWNSQELGPVSPAVFIPEAERLELIGPIDLWVLETAVGKCKEWKLDHCDTFMLNVNLSAAQLRDELLAIKIIKILKHYHFPGEKLCIEITESTSITFFNQSLRTIEQLREHDILVALDDFGTGYSSFGRLQSMPVNIVKIERTFVADIERNEYHQYLFRVMTDLAHAANMQLIAEGIERKGQMDILVKGGADYLQGYLFAKPLPSSELEYELGRFFSQAPSALQSNYSIGNDSVANIDPAF